MKLIILLFNLFFITSCGLKVTNEVEENLLVGSWELTNIFCYRGNDADFAERYDLSSSSEPKITLEFGRSNVQYEVEDSSCTTSAYATYITELDGDFTDTVDFTDVVTGSTCDINLSFVGQTTNGTADVKFTLLATKSSNLTWEINDDKTQLTLDMFTAFVGSNTGAACGSGCSCKLRFKKTN